MLLAGQKPCFATANIVNRKPAAWKIAILLTCFIWSIFSAAPSLATGWQLEKSEQGVVVYSQPMAGSRLLRVKAEIIINTSIHPLLAAFQDIANFPDWHHQTSNAVMLESISQIERFTYQNLNMPFPLKNRNLIIHSKLSRTQQGFMMTSVAKPKFCQMSASNVCKKIRDSQNTMITTANIGQHFIQLKNGRTKLVWTQFVDPAANAPAYLINRALVDLPFKTLNKLRALIESGKYKNAQFDLNQVP